MMKHMKNASKKTLFPFPFNRNRILLHSLQQVEKNTRKKNCVEFVNL